jgi:hypothetical protein
VCGPPPPPEDAILCTLVIAIQYNTLWRNLPWEPQGSTIIAPSLGQDVEQVQDSCQPHQMTGGGDSATSLYCGCHKLRLLQVFKHIGGGAGGLGPRGRGGTTGLLLGCPPGICPSFLRTPGILEPPGLGEGQPGKAQCSYCFPVACSQHKFSLQVVAAASTDASTV